MTDRASADRAPVAALFRLAWRESRTARRRLLLYMSSIALGVAALVAIDSFAGNVGRSVREQSRALLGGDVSFSSRAPFPKGVRAWGARHSLVAGQLYVRPSCPGCAPSPHVWL